MASNNKKRGCSKGCREYALIGFLMVFLLVVGNLLPALANIDVEKVVVDESEVFVAPIIEADTTSLKGKLSACGLTTLSENFDGETYVANTQTISSDLVLTGNEFGALFNMILLNEFFCLGEVIVKNDSAPTLEFKVKMDVSKIVDLSAFGVKYMYANLTFGVNRVDGEYKALDAKCYIYGYKETDTDTADDIIRILMTFFNGDTSPENEMRGLEGIFGASEIQFGDDRVTFKATPTV